MTDKITIDRELELIDGMIEVQLHHAKQCDGIANRKMAEKQKGWDMERVALLRKMRAALAAQPAEPVAWRPCVNCIADRTTGRIAHSYCCPNDPATFKAAPPAPAAVPPGYALVPIEPTEAMIDKGIYTRNPELGTTLISSRGGKSRSHRRQVERMYRAMIAAGDKPPAPAAAPPDEQAAFENMYRAMIAAAGDKP